jgi:hypothetical protein
MYTCPHLARFGTLCSCSSLYVGARTRVRWQHLSVSERVGVNVCACVHLCSFVNILILLSIVHIIHPHRGTTERDLDGAFYSFGPMVRIDLKSGFAFVVSLVSSIL